MEDKIKLHIEKTEFKLKDFNRTYSKWNDYKPSLFITFFNENHKRIEYHFKEGLKYYLKEKIDISENKGEWVIKQLLEKPLSKRGINYFKTYINSITYNANKGFIKDWRSDLKENEIKGLTIIFYLRFYKTINSIMHEVFKDYLLNIESRQVVYNLN